MTLDRQRSKYRHLSDQQYAALVLRQTEEPGRAALALADTSRDPRATYHCPNCGRKLFSNEAKFASGSGWPAFYEPAEADNVRVKKDFRLYENGSYVGLRNEALCACGAHLGHVFKNENWATPTGDRYCINSSSLEARKAPH